MIEFFIAFFGIIYYVIKICGEKSAVRQIDRQASAKSKRRHEWVEEVTDQDVEHSVRMFCDDPRNFQKVKAEVWPFYDRLFEKYDFLTLYPRYQWFDKRLSIREMEMTVRCDSENAVRILMAKRGYLTDLDATFGSGLTLSFHFRIDYEIFLLCLEELEKHGFHYKFIGDKKNKPDYDWRNEYGWEI